MDNRAEYSQHFPDLHPRPATGPSQRSADELNGPPSAVEESHSMGNSDDQNSQMKAQEETAMLDEDYDHSLAWMNLFSDFLCFVIAVLAVTIVWYWLDKSRLLDVRHVNVEKPLDHVSVLTIREVMQKTLDGNLLSLDIETIREELEALDWVSSAQVTRSLPDGLSIFLEEHTPVARWNGHGTQGTEQGLLLSDRGVVFSSNGEHYSQLPVFTAPRGSELEVWQHYMEFSKKLKRMDKSIRAIYVSPRLAWTLYLDNGFRITLGREEPNHPSLMQRLERFVKYYPVVGSHYRFAGDEADMRYFSGFAVRKAERKGV